MPPMPTSKRQLGLGRETVRGTPVVPSYFLPYTKLTVVPHVARLLDNGTRGSAVKDYGSQAGVQYAEVTIDADIYPDTAHIWFKAILGDESVSGSSPAAGSVLNAATVVGAVNLLTTANTGMAPGAVVQIGTGVTAEVVTILAVTGAGPYTVTFTGGYTLRFAHASGEAVVPVSAPFSHGCSVFNGADLQPPSWTITDNPQSATITTRAFAAAQCSDMSITVADKDKLKMTAKFITKLGATVAAPIAAYGTLPPMPGWKGAPLLGGTAVPMFDATMDLKRAASPIDLVNAIADPAYIWAGDLEVTGKMMVLMESDAYYTDFATAVQRTLSIPMTTGAGATLASVNLASSLMDWNTMPIDGSKDWFELGGTYRCLSTVADAGASGGYSPVRITVQNAVSTPA